MGAVRSMRMQGRAFNACGVREVRTRRAGGMRARAESSGESSVLVCGGAGVAEEVGRVCVGQGKTTTEMRRAGSQAEPNESATQVQCDALQQSEVQAVFEQVKPSVVISSVGGSPQDPSADSDGNINLINAALNAGTQRFVLVSSIGAGESKQATPEQVYSALEPVLIEKEKAEARLTELQSHMSFTVLRPGGLKSDGRTNNATITEDTRVIGSINRQARSWIGIGYFSDWLNVVD